jgi:asparagine synthase (glutamine-hydrolysing)
MMRAIAGVLDYRRPPTEGPLAIMHAPARGDDGQARILCVIDGYVDNGPALALELGLPQSAAPELVVARGYERWRDDVLERLRGDFSVLVWDRAERRGLIACDQFGARSVFVCTAGSRLYFASDLRVLLELLPSRPPPDHRSLLEYLSLYPIANSRTMYEGVKQLPPAHAMRLDPTGWRGFRYWSPRFNGVLDGSADELAAEVKVVMAAAVRRRLAPTGLTAITMSGGLDSTTVAALAQQLAPSGVRSYSTAMPDFPDQDESFYVERMKEFTGVPVTTIPTRPRGMVAAGLENLRARGLPAISTTDFIRQPLYSAARGDSAGIVLGGDGGDEVFGPRTTLIAGRLAHGRLKSAVSLARRHPGVLEPPPLHRVLRGVLEIGYDAYRPHLLEDIARRARGPAAYSPPWLRADEARLLFEARPQTSWKRFQGPRWWAQLADTITRNHARVGLYDEMRRSAGQQGLDYRHPLLDFELVDLALRLPPELSFDPAFSRPLMRRAMRGSLPEEVRTRPTKANFVPIALYALLNDMATVKSVLSADDAEIYRYVRPDVAGDLVDGKLHGGMLNGAWMDRVWRLFMAECWLRDQSDPEHSTRLLQTADLPGSNGSSPTFLPLVPPAGRTYTPIHNTSTMTVEQGIDERR